MSEEVGGLWGGSWLEGADIQLKPPAFSRLPKIPIITGILVVCVGSMLGSGYFWKPPVRVFLKAPQP